LELFQAAVSGEPVAPEKEEELRVMFVALTRARRYCLVALPDDRHGLEVASRCASLGFAIVTM
jgi:superfamily I DNA/RNA helicase